MSQYTAGQVNLVNGSQTVTGVGTLFTKYVTVGSVFTVRDSNVPYVVGGITDDTHLTLAAPYAGATVNNTNYAITTSFTPTLQIAYPEQQDVETATLFKRAMLQIEKYLVTAAITAGTIAGVAMTGSTIDSTVIGATTPAAITATTLYTSSWLTVEGTATIAGGVTVGSQNHAFDDQGSYARLQSYNGKPFAINPLGNRVLVNGTTDNGADELQINGSIWSSADINFPNFAIRSSIIGYKKIQSYGVPLALNPEGMPILIGTTSNNGADALQVAGSMYVSSGYATGNAQGTPGSVELIANTGSPYSGRLSFGSDNSGWLFAISKNVGGTLSDLIQFRDSGLVTMMGRTSINNQPDDGATALQVNGDISAQGSILAVNGYRVGNYNVEQLRMMHDSAFISAYNGANSVRTGYLQFNAASTTTLMVEVNQQLALGTNSTTRMVIMPAGNVLMGSSVPADNGSDALQVNGNIYASGMIKIGGYAVQSTYQYGIGPNTHWTPYDDNDLYLGTGSLRWAVVYAVNGVIQTSDRTQKKAIADSTLGLDFINALRPVSYRWKDKAADNGVHYGLIAQEVDELLARIGVQSFAGLSKPKDAPMGLQYSEFIAPMIKAQQESYALIQRLMSRVDALEAQLP